MSRCDPVGSRRDHLNKFMSNFADIFRLRKPNLKPVNIRKLFEEITHLFKSDFDQREITLKWDIRQKIGLTLIQEILDLHGLEFPLEELSKQQTRFTIFYN